MQNRAAGVPIGGLPGAWPYQIERFKTMARDGKYLSFDRMMKMDGRTWNRTVLEQRIKIYEQAHSMIFFLMHEHRAKLFGFFQALADGKPAQTAWKSVEGPAPEQFEKAWRQFWINASPKALDAEMTGLSRQASVRIMLSAVDRITQAAGGNIREGTLPAATIAKINQMLSHGDFHFSDDGQWLPQSLAGQFESSRMDGSAWKIETQDGKPVLTCAFPDGSLIRASYVADGASYRSTSVIVPRLRNK